MLTEKVRLLSGIAFDGVCHKDVVLRTPIVKDVIEAEKESDGKGAIVLSLNVLKQRIESFGKIPKEKLTTDLLANLTDEDFERLQTATEYLKKKAYWQSEE
jgi:phage FluMu protein gp41